MTGDDATVTEHRVKLSTREEQVARAVAFDGLKAQETADRLGLEYETVKSYLKRVREKYRAAGVETSTVLKLRSAMLQDGHEESPTLPG